MHDHYDHNQTLVRESFQRNGRPLWPLAEIEARHELCEDVAGRTATFLAAPPQEGEDTSDSLQCCHNGLRARAKTFASAEAAWDVRGAADRQNWAQLAWLADTGSDADRSGSW